MTAPHPSIHLIYARARNGVIGREGVMPWHLPEDLAHFKQTTLGHPVIMGRKTWDSLPARFRPLPGRKNIVITRQADWLAQGAKVTHALDQAVEKCQGEDEIWVIGGAEVYRQALPQANKVVVTEIDEDFDGDAFAPDLSDAWKVVAQTPMQTSSTGLRYRFVTYARAKTKEKA